MKELVCINRACGARFGIDDVIYACTVCGCLLEARAQAPAMDTVALQRLWRERRLSNRPIDQSGVWRYREIIPYFDDESHVVTLREGDTPLLSSARAAAYCGLDQVVFK